MDYELTRLGKTLLEPVAALAMWADKNRVDIQAARDAFDGREKKTARRAGGRLQR